ncbi:MAG: hypothetical protein ACXW3Z_17510 [Limisphaerales bacterium]
MKASGKRALVYFATLVIGYVLGFYDGANAPAQIAVGPLLLAVVLFPLLLSSLRLRFFLWNRTRWSGGGSGPGDADYPPVPRPPTRRPPVLIARERLP